VLGVYLLVLSLEGWMLTRLTMLERVALFLAAIILPFPVGLKNLESVVACLVVITLAYLLQKRRVKREGAPGSLAAA
jgi:TRAP-type uncharacterized transport system fused permease subunit